MPHMLSKGNKSPITEWVLKEKRVKEENMERLSLNQIAVSHLRAIQNEDKDGSSICTCDFDELLGMHVSGLCDALRKSPTFSKP